MSGQGRLQTAIVAFFLVALGFGLGAGGSAWQTLEQRAEPWRKMQVEHQGTGEDTTRTRLVFENPKLAVQAVEIIRSPEGQPQLAHVVLLDGTELTAHYEKGSRPKSLEAPDGQQAHFTFKGSRARVAFVSAAGKKVGDKTLEVPAALRSALKLARADRPTHRALARLWEALAKPLIGEAWAQDRGQDDKVTVRRDVVVDLGVRMPGAKKPEPGTAEVEASCAPLTCVPSTPTVNVPGQTKVRVSVVASTPRASLKKPASKQALEAFRDTATKERSVAEGVLPDAAAVVAAVGVTALACRSVKLSGPLCVSKFSKSAARAGGAVQTILCHDVDRGRGVIDQRAEDLYYEDQARASLDRKADIQVCLSREGYGRACTKVSGRPFGAKPMAVTKRSVDMRRGIGGTLAGSFVMVQSDGRDCKFSPSPRTSGSLRMTFDNEKHTVTATYKANARGTRPNLTCSMGTATMSWGQTYSATATQTFTAEQLQSGGKLPLKLTGTMSGTGSYSSSNCRTRGGASANCPAGKSDSYTYRIEIVGSIDLDTQKGSGRILVHGAPLATSGTWRIPPEAKP